MEAIAYVSRAGMWLKYGLPLGLLLVGLVVCPRSKALSQDADAADPIRVKVSEVPVDVIVLTREGDPILDLKKQDFKVLEDGVPQEIRHFSPESHLAPKPGLTDSRAGESDGELTSATPSRETHSRTFLIFVGRGRHRFSKQIPALIAFIHSGLQPNDRVSFMAFGRAADFTSDHETLIPVLQRYQEIAPSIEARIEMRINQTARVIADPESLSLRDFQAEIDRIFDSGEERGHEIASRHAGEIRSDAVAAREHLLEAEKRAMQLPRGYEANSPRPDPGEGGYGTSRRMDGAGSRSFDSISSQIEQDLVRDGMDLGEFMKLQSEGRTDVSGLSEAIEYMRFLSSQLCSENSGTGWPLSANRGPGQSARSAGHVPQGLLRRRGSANFRRHTAAGLFEVCGRCEFRHAL